MSIRINSNILSMNAQRRLAESSNQLQSSFSRLSSGLRITNASDDAAGLAISETLKLDSRLSSQALRNVNDGISMISIINSAFDAQKGILYRMAELAEQSANGVMSSGQRRPLQEEYMALQEEFDRVASAAKFNGISLLRNPEASTIGLMAGITGADASLLNVAAANSHRFAGDVATRWYFIGTPIPSVQFGMSGEQLFNPEFGQTSGEGRVQDYGVVYVTDSTGANVKLKISTFGELAGVSYTVGKLYNAQTNEALSAASAFLSTTDTFQISLTNSQTGGSVIYNTDRTDSIFNDIYIDNDARSSAIGYTNVEGRISSLRALDIVKNRIEDLSKLQGGFGAVEARLEVAANQLSVSRENFQSAASQITDVDVATEAATLTLTQILQQAATAVLAQANQQPELALQLLGGV
jgi:flagellin